MGCSSCGGGGGGYRAPAMPSAVTGVAQPDGTKYRVTFPNGTTQTYVQYPHAVQAQAMRGGTIEVLTPEQQRAEEAGDQP